MAHLYQALLNGEEHVPQVAHLTTLAGYVHGNSGQRYVLVAMINHPNAGGARPVMDALVDWVAQD